MTRGFGGRLHPRHVRTIHNPSSSDDRGNHTQGHQHSSQSSGALQSSFRPLAPRGRWGKRFGGRFGNQPRRLFCLFCGEDKRHTTRTCQVTIQKQKEMLKLKHGRTRGSGSCILVGVSTPGGGVPRPTSKLSMRVPAQMGWRGMEHKMWDKPCIILH
jgi:hypothetical protein